VSQPLNINSFCTRPSSSVAMFSPVDHSLDSAFRQYLIGQLYAARRS
jgi:hypothetical protein